MKKLLFYFLGFLFILGLTYGFNCYAYSETGHEDFRSITFVEEGKLLVDYSDSEIETAYEAIPKKAFGWKTYYFNVNAAVHYDGTILFARSNLTTKAISLDYSLRETETTETSVTVKGSVSTKISGTISKIKTTIAGTIEGSASKEDTNTYTSDAKTVISLQVPAKSKVIMLLTGDAYVTSGVSKYRFFGITIRKGEWERIEVDTVYYELREEKIK